MPIPAPVPSRHARLPGALFRPLRAALCAALGTLSAGAWAQASTPAAGTAPAPLLSPSPSPLSVHAAGSLRAAPTEAAQAFERQSGTKVALTFGASGPLKDRLVAGKHADVFVTCCINAAQAVRENPALQTCPLTQKLEVSAVYGLAPLQPATPAADAFRAFLRGPEGQAVLRGYGFRSP